MSWNPQGSLSQSHDPRRRVIWQLTKDAEGNEQERFFVYDGWKMLAEYDGEGSLVCEYVHGAQVDEMLMKRIPQGAYTYYHQDGLGGTVRLSSEDGEILEQYTYDAFGTPQLLEAQGNALPESTEGGTIQTNTCHLFTGRE